MGRDRSTELPEELERARTRFEEWRATRVTRRIPAELWQLAEELSIPFGIHRTARALRLNDDSLRKRLRAKTGGSTKTLAKSSPTCPPAFVELTSSVASEKLSEDSAGRQGAAELEAGDGARLRVWWQGPAPDLGLLNRSFFFGESS